MPVNTSLHPYDDQGQGTCPIKGVGCDYVVDENIGLGSDTDIPEAVSIKFDLGETFTDEQQQIANTIRVEAARLNQSEQKKRSEDITRICTLCKELTLSFVGPLKVYPETYIIPAK